MLRAVFESDAPPASESKSRTGYLFGYETYIGTDYAIKGESKLRFRLALRGLNASYGSGVLDLGGMVFYLSYTFPGG